MTPYEYHNDILGVQARFLIDGRDAISESLRFIGDRGLRMRISKGYIKRLRPNGPGTPMLVSWLTLPAAWQRQLIETFGEPAKQLKQSWFEKHYERDLVALEYYLSYRLDDEKTLPDDVIEEYVLNASVLNTVDKVYSNRYALRKAMRGAVKDIWTIVSNECNRFKDVWPHTLPTNPASLRRKLRQYNNGGYEVLIHGNWCNKSALKVDDSVMSLLNALFADNKEKPTATEVSRRYEGFLTGYVEVYDNETGEMYDPAVYPKLSAATVKNYLAKWVNKAATHTVRSGDRQKWLNAYIPHHTLQQPKVAGSIISIDDRQPPFEYAPGKRVWFYNGIDLASEAYTVWVYGKTKEGIIDDFYRQLVRNYTEWGLQLPTELEAEMSLNSKFRDTFLQDGSLFQYVHIEANNARAKRIERYFGAMRYEIEKGQEGWLARPFAGSESNQAGPRETPLIPYDEIITRSLLNIQTWNNMEHSKIKGKSRWEVFMENQPENPRPTNWRAFLPYLGQKVRTSCNRGIIKFQKTEFVLGNDGQIAYSDRLIRLMDQIEGREVDVYWMRGNDDKVLKALVYQPDSSRFVCEAIYKPIYNRARAEQTPDDEEAKTAMAKYVASVTGFINHGKKAITKITTFDNRPKTISNSFKIDLPSDGLATTPSAEMPVDDGFDAFSLKTTPDYEEPEVLDDIDTDDDLNGFENRFTRSLKDRF